MKLTSLTHPNEQYELTVHFLMIEVCELAKQSRVKNFSWRYEANKKQQWTHFRNNDWKPCLAPSSTVLSDAIASVKQTSSKFEYYECYLFDVPNAVTKKNLHQFTLEIHPYQLHNLFGESGETNVSALEWDDELDKIALLLEHVEARIDKRDMN